MVAGPKVDYRVTGVADDTQFTAGSSPVPGKRVSFSTSTGYDGSVFLPDTVFGDMAAVRALIEATVYQVAAAHGLSGSIGG